MGYTDWLLFALSPFMKHLTPNLSDLLISLMLRQLVLAQVRQCPGGSTSSCKRHHLSARGFRASKASAPGVTAAQAPRALSTSTKVIFMTSSCRRRLFGLARFVQVEFGLCLIMLFDCKNIRGLAYKSLRRGRRLSVLLGRNLRTVTLTIS